MKTQLHTGKKKSARPETGNESESRWLALFEHMKETVMTLNRKSEILSINHVQQGFTRQDVIGKSVYYFVSPDKQAYLKKQLAGLLRNGNSFDFDDRIEGPDGSIAWYYSVYSPIFDDNGKVREYMIITHNITPMKEAQQKMLTAMFEGQEAERKRVSAELHDGLGQNISAIQLSLQQLRDDCKDISNKKLDKTFAFINDMVKKASDEVRAISRNLAPPRLEEFGLTAAIEDFCNQVNSTGKMRVSFECKGLDTRPGHNLEINIYRITQELVNNAGKHSAAKNCRVHLSTTNNAYLLKVSDNGKGFNTTRKTQGLGLQNVSARAKVHKGKVEITSLKGKGTTVLVTIPRAQNTI